MPSLCFTPISVQDECQIVVMNIYLKEVEFCLLTVKHNLCTYHIHSTKVLSDTLCIFAGYFKKGLIAD